MSRTRKSERPISSSPPVTPGAVYEKLISCFGPQGWWPVTRAGEVRPEYRPLSYLRTGEAERFEICVGAILTQNTAWTNVERALANLHGERLMVPDRIAATGHESLAALIRPSGYYNQKAERLRLFSAHLCAGYGGSPAAFFGRPSEEVRRELLSLKGIGPETADSMLLYAGNSVAFVVDAYTFRLGERMGWFRGREYEAVQRFFVEELSPGLEMCNEYHALIVALGKHFCRKTPRCGGCPLGGICPSRTGEPSGGREEGKA